MSAETSSSSARRPESESDPEAGLRLRALPVASESAFALDHAYFEIVYAPLIGPTAVLLARALARHLEVAGGRITVCPIELAMEIGIRAGSGDPLGRKSHLVHAIDRLAHDHVVARLGDRTLGVRVAIPPLSQRTLEKLPETSRRAHHRLLAAGVAPPE